MKIKNDVSNSKSDKPFTQSPASADQKFIIIFCLFYLLIMLPAFAAANENAMPSPTADYIQYTCEGNYFSVLIPRHWEKSEKNHPYGDLTKIYGVKLTGEKNKDGAAVKISILYYTGEGLFKTAGQYMTRELNSMVRIDYDRKAEIEKTMLAGHPAKTFHIRTFELIYQPMHNQSPMKEGVVYEIVPPHKQVTMIQQFIVLPASRGFYVLRLNVPEDMAEQYSDIFAKITKSFMPLLQ
jgi:hypothetical protein